MGRLRLDKVDSIFSDISYSDTIDYDWNSCYHIIQKGGHISVITTPLQYHKVASDIENANFEIRDMIIWTNNNMVKTIILARKPIEKNIYTNCLQYGIGGINIDECRVPFISEEDKKESVNKNRHQDFNSNNGIRVPTKGIYGGDNRPPENYNPEKGRFPSNFIHDNSNTIKNNFGKASRFFHTITDLYVLYEYIIKLITPKGKTIFIPFINDKDTLQKYLKDKQWKIKF